MLDYLSRRLHVTFYFLFYFIFAYFNNSIRNTTDNTEVSLWGGPSLCTFSYILLNILSLRWPPKPVLVWRECTLTKLSGWHSTASTYWCLSASRTSGSFLCHSPPGRPLWESSSTRCSFGKIFFSMVTLLSWHSLSWEPERLYFPWRLPIDRSGQNTRDSPNG